MQVGKLVNVPNEWKLGEKHIQNTSTYKYLGDSITSDGKNKQNISMKQNKLQQIIRQINTTASSEVMCGIETRVILELYDKFALTAFLNNSESWTLSISEEKEVDKLGIQAMKRLFNLPEKTPSVAIIYSLGLTYTTQSIDQRKFMYFHKILNKGEHNWTRKMLYHLRDQNIGWAKCINGKLGDNNLETNWEQIRPQTRGQWKRTVEKAIKETNKRKLLQNSTTSTPEGIKINTKTKHIHEAITTRTYEQKPLEEVANQEKQRTKTIILARNGMLECGKNFKGSMSELCLVCNVVDDEEHRLNHCMKWEEINNLNRTKVDFRNIYSNDCQILNHIVTSIERVWELRYANGRMKRIQ